MRIIWCLLALMDLVFGVWMVGMAMQGHNVVSNSILGGLDIALGLAAGIYFGAMDKAKL